MIVFDDTCEEIFNEKNCVKLATAGRHKNVYVILCQAQFISAK